MKFEDFTKEERMSIAEFVIAYENDVFIKSDGRKMINIFLAKEIIDIFAFFLTNDYLYKFKIHKNKYDEKNACFGARLDTIGWSTSG